MKLIVGLGNPGREYEATRHNVGFAVVDRLVQRHAGGQPPRAKFHAATYDARIGEHKCLLLKPNTFMNRSGQAVGESLRFHKTDPVADLIVVVDDVALPTGALRLRGGGGAGGHNGLTDIERALGTASFPRARVGIGASPSYMDQADYVLGRFSEFEYALVNPTIDLAADAVETFVRSGIDAAMNKFNTRQSDEGEDAPPPGWITPDN